MCELLPVEAEETLDGNGDDELELVVMRLEFEPLENKPDDDEKEEELAELPVVGEGNVKISTPNVPASSRIPTIAARILLETILDT